MKKTVHLICAIIISTLNSSAQFVTIPDANFKAFLQSSFPTCFDANGKMDSQCNSVKSATFLNLNGKQIASLEGIEYFIKLENLEASSNKLTVFPTFPTSLNTLRCSNNSFTTLPTVPNSIIELHCGGSTLTTITNPLPNSLKIFYCNYSSVSSLPTLPITLKKLDISNSKFINSPALSNGLEDFRCDNNILEALSNLPSTLTWLSVKNNKIKTLPSLPSKLKRLYTNNNLLYNLPALPSGLNYLEVANNQLKSLPTTLPDSLSVLSCNSNYLKTLPSIPALVQYLNIGSNCFEVTPSFLRPFISLSNAPNRTDCLDFYNNLLVTIPDANLKSYLEATFPACFDGNGLMDKSCSAVLNTTILDVSAKQIANLDGLQYFGSLKQLNASNNLLTSSTSEPYLPSSLERLFFDNNNLTSLGSISPKITTLSVKENKIVSLPSLPSSLVSLFCTDNLLTELPSLPSNLGELFCGKNGLTVLPSLPNKLAVLGCGDNKLTNLPQLPTSLGELFCEKNLITSLPSLPSNLYDFNCSGNMLETLPNLPINLAFLDASFNKLTSVPSFPGNMVSINLSNNQLKTIGTLPITLTNLELANNLLKSLPVFPTSLNVLVAGSNCFTTVPVAINPSQFSKFEVTPNRTDFDITASLISPTKTICKGDEVQLSVSVLGSTPDDGRTYQWKKGGQEIAGATAINYVIAKAQLSDAGSYTCEVTNCCKKVETQAYALVVNTIASNPIIGKSTICTIATGQVYEVNNVPGNSFLWTLPTGATNTTRLDNSSITFNVSGFSTSDSIQVLETNLTTGCKELKKMYISPLTIPVTTAIQGASNACGNIGSLTYEVTKNIGSSYNWSVPTEFNIESGQGTNQLKINLIDAKNNGNIKVVETAANGCKGVEVEYAITILAFPSTSEITGKTEVCPNEKGLTYSVTPTSESTYEWTVPSTITVLSGNGTSGISVNCSNYNNSENVSVTETNSEGCKGALKIIAVSSLTQPTISGPSSICSTSENITFSVPNSVGSTYKWVLPAGLIVNGSSSGNSISVNAKDFLNNSNIAVVENDGTKGCLALGATKQLISNPLPSIGNLTKGLLVNCWIDNNHTFATTLDPNPVNYYWEVSDNGQIISSNLNNAVIKFNNDTAAFVKLTKVSKTTGCSVSSKYSIAGAPKPVISGKSLICRSDKTGNYEYTVTPVSPNNLYIWFIENSKFIGSGDKISINFSNYLNDSYEIKATLQTSDGCFRETVLPISFIKAPVNSTKIVGESFTCPGQSTASYKLDKASLGYSYIWDVKRATNVTEIENGITVDLSDIIKQRSNAEILVYEFQTAEKCLISTISKTVYGFPIAPVVTGRKILCDDIPANYSVSDPNPLSIYKWTTDGSAIITSSSNTPDIKAGLTGSNGTVLVEETTSQGCESLKGSAKIVKNPFKYVVDAQSFSCSINSYSVSIKTPVLDHGLKKLEFCISYNPSFASYTGFTKGKFYYSPDFSVTESTIGTLNVTIEDQINGLYFIPEIIIKLNFTANYSNMNVGDKNVISSCNIQETYSNGEISNCYNFTSYIERTATKSILDGYLKIRNYTTPLSYDKDNTSLYIPTIISGAMVATCSGASSIQYTDLNGNFKYDLANGEYLNFNRDIAPTQDVSAYINAADAQSIARLVKGTSYEYITMYDLLAADVDQDGKITEFDYLQVLNRSANKSFKKQDKITETPDWIFTDQDYSQQNGFSPENFNLYDGLASFNFKYNSEKVLPPTVECFQIKKIGSGDCVDVPTATYQGILMGDMGIFNMFSYTPPFKPIVYAGQPKSGLRMARSSASEDDYSITVDITKSEFLPNGNLKIPVYLFASNEGTSFDFQLDFDETKIEIDTVYSAQDDLNKDIILAANVDNGVLKVGGFALEEIFSNINLVYIEAKLPTTKIDAESFGTLKLALINGNPVNGVVKKPIIDGTDDDLTTETNHAYPNPTTGEVFISKLEGKQYSYSVTDILGNTLKDVKDHNSSKIDLNTLPTGTYLLNINYLDQKSIHKISLVK